MHPILLQFGKISIYTYGFSLAIAFLSGLIIAKKEAARRGEDPNKITDLAFYMLIAAIIGSRVFYILTNIDAYIADPLEIVRIWNGGLVFYGGFIGALLVGIIYVKKHKMRSLMTMDIFAPALAFGQFIGRIGCFFAGCCYGKTCKLPFAITFTNPNSLAPINTPLHPTQLYSAASNLTIFVVLMLLRGKIKIEGQLFWTYTILYACMRIIIEFFRGDFRGEIVLGMFSLSQTIGGVMIVISIIILLVLKKRAATS